MEKERCCILEQVAVLFMKYGIKSVTMDDIARYLGISKKTVYQYVADKTELVGKFLEYELKKKAEIVDEAVSQSENAIEALCTINYHMNESIRELNPSTEYDLKKYYPDLYHRLDESRKLKMYETIIENIRRGKGEGLYRPEVNEEIISKLQVIRATFICSDEVISINEYTSKDFFREFLVYHIRGIATFKGIEVFEQNIKKFDNRYKIG
jgi:TetR/AcrR family transcriptional regulator, cholesterol catabolism regulator